MTYIIYPCPEHFSLSPSLSLSLSLNAPQHINSYVNLRTWRVFTLASPECGVPPTSTPFGDDYPFSMKVPATRKLTLKDIMAIQVCTISSTANETHVLLWLPLSISSVLTILDGHISHVDTSHPSNSYTSLSTTPYALSHHTSSLPPVSLTSHVLPPSCLSTH